MSGTVKQFVDFSVNTNNDTGENSAASIVPFVNGENVVAAVLNRPGESIRQRTEALRNVEEDTLYLRDADRGLVLTGPGKISWPGSTTASASGIVSTDDTLYLLPLLTPGYAQTAPVPPVASVYGTLHLLRASDSMQSIVVTSQRRSYSRGDQISVTVSSGASFSCTLAVAAAGYQRTIQIVAAPTTTLSTVISALNALTPLAPDNTPLVTAALENGAAGTDLILAVQAKQYVSGNYDGEAHAIIPADLSAFFVANPAEALAEGDTLCIRYDTVTDPASTGGRRQSTPENANTAIPSGSFFNSRVHPEYLVNALPICKVVNNNLVFGTGVTVLAGSSGVSLDDTVLNLFTWDASTPSGEGTLALERFDRTYSAAALPPAFSPLGRVIGLGSKLLAAATDALKARVSAPYSSTFAYTLLWASQPDTGTNPALRIYASSAGHLFVTVNAYYDTATSKWNKDLAGTIATCWDVKNGAVEQYGMLADVAWTTWSPISKMALAQTVTAANPNFAPLLELFDSAGNRRVGFDHLGLHTGRKTEYLQTWIDNYASWTQSVVNGGLNSITNNSYNGGPGYTQQVFAIGDEAKIVSPLVMGTPINADAICVLEFECDVTHLGTAAFSAGYNQGNLGTQDYVIVVKAPGSAFWALQSFNKAVGGLPGFGVVLSTIPATGKHRIRLEWYGNNLPGGQRALLFVDGALAAEQNDANKLPSTNDVSIGLALRAGLAPGAAEYVDIGPVRHVMQRVPNEDAV